VKTLLQCIVVWPAEQQAPGLMHVTDRLLAETLFMQQENHTNVTAAVAICTTWATVWVKQVPFRNQTTYTCYEKLNANCIKIDK
jgi:hypothetical protein